MSITGRLSKCGSNVCVCLFVVFTLLTRGTTSDVKHRAIVTQTHFRRYRLFHVRLFFIWFFNKYIYKSETVFFLSSPPPPMLVCMSSMEQPIVDCGHFKAQKSTLGSISCFFGLFIEQKELFGFLVCTILSTCVCSLHQ